MPKFKCHNCNITDSVHKNDEGTSQVIMDKGPPDRGGLDQYILYCRSCSSINFYKPGWIGNLKFQRFINPQTDLPQDLTFEDFISTYASSKIQSYMVEDKLLPGNWVISNDHLGF